MRKVKADAIKAVRELERQRGAGSMFLLTGEAGIGHREENNLVRSILDQDDGDAPVIHLTYTLAGFDKVRYVPWEPIPRGQHAGLDYAADLVDELREREISPLAAFQGRWGW